MRLRESAKPWSIAGTPSGRGDDCKAGFAIITTVSILVLLAVIAVGLLSLSSVSVRSSQKSHAMAAARANARLALVLALGDLQKAAGPDQRVTAAADLLPEGAGTGRAFWTGVWDTSDYDPAEPGQTTFLRWLVSSKNGGAPTTLEEAVAAAGGDDTLIFDGQDSESAVRVEKLDIEISGGMQESYAYWVEDEGVKANLGWSEGGFAEEGRKQVARLTAAPGVDFEVFDGPFSEGVSHPIEREQGNPWLVNIDKAISAADMPLVKNVAGDHHAWLRERRHDMAIGTRGVLADVKKGGLRRDLSLAFEMDGDADVTARDQPTKFNAQTGEFVGGSDSLGAKHNSPGMPVRERFLYRVTKGDGSPFSDALQRGDSVVRGPNWWAMRDYYNLYKRIEGRPGNHTMRPRSYFPNNSAGKGNTYRHIAQPRHPFTASMWDDEVTGNGQYVFHPARANYAPVLMGAVGLYSAKVVNRKLTLTIDPMIYLWNPFNIALKVDRYGVAMQRGHGGKVTFKVIKKDEDGNVTGEQTYGPAKTDVFIKRKLQVSGEGASGNLTYLVSDLTMAPGEVVVVSPGAGSGGTEYHDAVTPGTNLTDSSGIHITQMPKTTYNGQSWDLVGWVDVVLNPGDEVRCLYDVLHSHKGGAGGLTNSAEHFWLAGFLPNSSTVKARDLVNADTNADRVQTIGGNFAGRNWAGIQELLVPDVNNISQYPDSEWPSFVTRNVGGGKFFFGINSHLLKPAQHTNLSGEPMTNEEGVEVQNAVEVFSQFNPFRTASFVEGHRVCQFNEAYSSISKPGSINGFIQEIGVQFPPTQTRRGYWGENYHGGGGSTAVPFIDLPTAPILSLADFANANLSLRASEPYKKVGNSHASIFVPSDSLYGQPGESARAVTASDGCWLINDALFDRYCLSGIAPEFTIGAGGYSATGSVEETLAEFFGADYREAEASPVLRPYLPEGKTVSDVVGELSADDGYKKMGAYSLIDGAFNVNSTSVVAWEGLLRANRSLAVADSLGNSNSGGEGTPFPNGSMPTGPGQGARDNWAGFSRLTDENIATLAENLVYQVKARGPFMSLSDFVNRELSGNTDLNAAGALQTALDQSGAMYGLKVSAGGIEPVDPPNRAWKGPNFAGDADLSGRLSTEGIAGDIRQADLLRPLAPRLSARSDTFRIRGYGEVRSADGTTILAQATCEAVIQRVPEYLDPTDEPWEEGGDSANPTLTAINEKFGRRFKVVQFRWLAPNEV